MNSELDRIFEQGLSDLTRSPKTPLSDEQIAAVAKESKSGAVLWLRMHVKELLAFVILLAVGIGGTLLVTHYIGNQRVEPEPAEPVAAVVCDTAMVADDTDVRPAEPTTSTVETRHGTSLQNDQPVATSANPNAQSAVTAVETLRATSLQNDRHTPSVTDPVIVKKTIVQHDTVRVKESVIVKDTVFVE